MSRQKKNESSEDEMFDRVNTDNKNVLFDIDGTGRDNVDDDIPEYERSPTQKEISKAANKGQDKIMNLFLADDGPKGNKRKGGKNVKGYKDKLEYEEKLKKLPGLIGKDNIVRLKDQKDELEDLREEIEYMEK